MNISRDLLEEFNIISMSLKNTNKSMSCFPVKAEFKEGEVIKVRSFLTKLLAVKKEFVSSVDLNGNENQITTSISMGLRLLHNLKLIELIYTPDSSDIWHLTESYAHKIKRDITEIKVLRG